MANYASLQFFDNFSEENVNGAGKIQLRVSLDLINWSSSELYRLEVWNLIIRITSYYNSFPGITPFLQNDLIFRDDMHFIQAFNSPWYNDDRDIA